MTADAMSFLAYFHPDLPRLDDLSGRWPGRHLRDGCFPGGRAGPSPLEGLR